MKCAFALDMYLHGNKPSIVHRDLTPNNILFSSHLEVNYRIA